MKKAFLQTVLILAGVMIMISGCTAGAGQIADGPGMVNSYTQISQTEAMQMMKADDGHVVVDVRRQDEYDAGHIPGAILLPNESIGDEPPEQLPDKDQIILVYCRSGRRSKEAAQKLFDMGYRNIYEFGGIITWTGDVVTTAEEQARETVKPVPMLVIETKNRTFYANPEENASAKALVEKLSAGPIIVRLSDYGDFEKVGPLPWKLPASDERITTVPGDIILYQGDRITIYYDENTWNFTRLARIEDVTRQTMLEALGEGTVDVTFSVEWAEVTQ